MSSKSSRTDLPETVLVGRILRPHGVRGELVVELLTEIEDRVAVGRRLLLTDADARPRQGAGRPAALAASAAVALPAELEVVASRPHKSGALVRFRGIGDRDEADRFRGGWLAVPRSQVPEPPPGTYYHYQLLGCRCQVDGEDLGVVVDLLEDGGGLLLIVEGGDKRRVPVPFVQSFLRAIDVTEGTIDLVLPEGLLEACASTS